MFLILIFIFLCLYIRYSVSEEWTIHVYTGTERYAGTDSNVFLRLFNSKIGYTNEYELTHENWLIGNALFPFKNLFEHGAHDRFRIATEKFEFIEKIHVRRDNFPLVRSDWLLDRIVIERNRDSTKFTFECNCWLRSNEPDITIPVSSDLRSIDKNNSWKDKQSIVVILIVSIVCIIPSLCCIHKCCRRRDFVPIQSQEPSPVVNRYYPQIPEPSAPPLLNNILNPWENIQQTLSFSNNTTVVVVVQSTDEPPPPAYKDLFPD